MTMIEPVAPAISRDVVFPMTAPRAPIPMKTKEGARTLLRIALARVSGGFERGFDAAPDIIQMVVF